MVSCIAAGYRLAKAISCHAISPSGNILAICPNGCDVLVLVRSGNRWEVVNRLEGHDQVVSGLHFFENEKIVRLVSSSHDRNSYVWTLQQPSSLQNQEGTAARYDNLWSTELVITKLSRAGLCVQWSNNGKKFAIGSCENSVCLCYFDVQRELWAPKLIKKHHSSSITGIAWHPEGLMIATVSTDKKCRIFNTFLQGVDECSIATQEIKTSRFGDVLFDFDSEAWILAVAWSPGGDSLAFCSQNSTLTFVTGISLKEAAALDSTKGKRQQILQLPSLPLKCLTFLSDSMLVGAGFDCKPLIFQLKEDGIWSCIDLKQDIKFISGDRCTQNSSLLDRIKLFEGQVAQRQLLPDNEVPAIMTKGASDLAISMPTWHTNCITCVTAKGRSAFLSSGLDGMLVEWELILS